MARFYVGCWLLLFFSTAWLRSDRCLASALAYKLPLSVRWRFMAIRLYWLADLALSAMVVLAYAPLAGLPGQLLVTGLLGGLETDAAVSHLSYPLAAILLGYFWPQIATFTVSVGRGNETTYRLSFGQLRDYLLGGPALKLMNGKLQVAVASYVDRVVDAASRPGDDTAPRIREAIGLAATPLDRHQMREALLERAAQDCEALFLAVSRVKMIPLFDRRRPLMTVPDMTAQEEEVLYRAGIETVGDLIRATDVHKSGLASERITSLRMAARQLMAQRVRLGLGLAGIVGLLLGLGSWSLDLYHQDPMPREERAFVLGTAANAAPTGLLPR